MLRSILLFSLINIIISSCVAQITQQWAVTYNGPANGMDIPIKMVTDEDDNVYVAGTSDGVNTGEDILVIKYNSSGIQQWVARYNGSANGIDEGHSIAVDAAGNVFVAGLTFETSGLNAIIIKYNSNGLQQWVAEYGRPEYTNNEFNRIAVDALGNVYAAGAIGNGTNTDYVVIKYNTLGVRQWVAEYNGSGNDADNPSSIVLDALGNIYVSGSSIGAGTGYDFATVKYNSLGAEQWVARYNGPSDNIDLGKAMKVNNNCDVFVTGNSVGENSDYDIVCIKYNSSGVQQWLQRYNGPGNNADEVSAMALDGNSNVYIAGYSQSNGTDWDYVTIKYSASGTQQWVTRYNGPANEDDNAGDIAVNNMGNIFVTGQSRNSNNFLDYATIKYNSSGVQQWVVRYHGPDNGNDGANNILLDSYYNIYLMGTVNSTSGHDGSDMNVIKYSQCNYSISGQVTYQDNKMPVLSGYVKALFYNPDGSNIITVDSTPIGENGTYMLSHTPGDSIYIMVYQNDDQLNFVPTYYPSTIDWQQASKVYPSQNSNNIDIKVFRINNKSNPYNISGFTQSENVLSNLSGAVVYAQIGKDFKNYGVSLSDGSYIIDKLPSGSYTLTAYRLGYNKTTRYVKISSNNITMVNFSFINPCEINIQASKNPTFFALYQNFPNPFNPTTNIKYQIASSSYISLIIYDILGREVTTLVNEKQNSGSYNVKFDGTKYSSGVYFYKLVSGDYTETKKLILLK